MSALKPWQKKATSLTTSSSEDIITPSGENVSANTDALAANALQKGNTSTVHKSPTSAETTSPSTPNTNNTTTTGYNRPSAYGSSYSPYNRYGGGMYGSGMYGGGMYGGGMYGGGMYGNSMYGTNMDAFNQYLFSVCQAAQMIEYNANGIGNFVMLAKNFFTWAFSASHKGLIY